MVRLYQCHLIHSLCTDSQAGNGKKKFNDDLVLNILEKSELSLKYLSNPVVISARFKLVYRFTLITNFLLTLKKLYIQNVHVLIENKGV